MISIIILLKRILMLNFEMKKLLDTNWKEFKLKSVIYETDKIPFSCFDDKSYVLDDGIYTLAYFHKNSVTCCKEMEKDCDKKDSDKEDCYIWKKVL